MDRTEVLGLIVGLGAGLIATPILIGIETFHA
jgi:hypothetical protein